jgi:hypothetical protein
MAPEFEKLGADFVKKGCYDKSHMANMTINSVRTNFFVFSSSI